MAKVGTVSVDFQAGIANLVSGVDAVNQKLGGVGKSLSELTEHAETAEKGLSFLTKFAAGSAAGAGLAGLVSHLYHVAEGFADVSPAAKQFTYEIDSLRAKLAESFLPVFEKLVPFFHTFNDLLEHGGDMWTNWGKKADDALTVLGNNPVLKFLNTIGEQTLSGGILGMLFNRNTNPVGDLVSDALTGSQPIGQTTREMAQQGVGLNKPPWMAGWDAEWARELKVYQEFLDNMEEIRRDKEKEVFARKQDMFFFELQGTGAEQEFRQKQLEASKQATANSFKEADQIVLKQHQDMWKAAAKQAEDAGTFIADSFVQAQDDGFKAVLASWARTLEQMMVKALATDLFGAMFGEQGVGGTSGFLGKFFSGLFGRGGAQPIAGAGLSDFVGPGLEDFIGNFAAGADFVVSGSGGPDSRFMRVSPGERVRVSPPAFAQGMADSAGNITVVNNNTFNGNMDRSDYLRLLEANRLRTIADVRSSKKRRWD